MATGAETVGIRKHWMPDATQAAPCETWIEGDSPPYNASFADRMGPARTRVSDSITK